MCCIRFWWRLDGVDDDGGGGQSVIWKKPWVRQAVRMEEMRSTRRWCMRLLFQVASAIAWLSESLMPHQC